jgi:hypothetical protein
MYHVSKELDLENKNPLHWHKELVFNFQMYEASNKNAVMTRNKIRMVRTLRRYILLGSISQKTNKAVNGLQGKMKQNKYLTYTSSTALTCKGKSFIFG